MDYFTKTETLSAQWSFISFGSKLNLHKKENPYWLLNINHNLGDSVAVETVSEPACHFQHCQVKIQYNNICKLFKNLQMNKNYNIQRNKNYKSFSENMEMNTKKN